MTASESSSSSSNNSAVAKGASASALAAAYIVAAARDGEPPSFAASAASSPSPPPPTTTTQTTAAVPAATRSNNKLSQSEELRTQICSNKYCQCVRRDDKMHRVQDLVRARLVKERLAKQLVQQQRVAQQAQLEAQARDFLASLEDSSTTQQQQQEQEQSPMSTQIPASTTAAAAETTGTASTSLNPSPATTTTTTTTTFPATTASVVSVPKVIVPAAAAAAPSTTKKTTPISYHQALHSAIKRLDPKQWKTHANFARKTRRIQVAWNYGANNHNQDDVHHKRTSTTVVSAQQPPAKRRRSTYHVPRTIQTLPSALLHSKRGSFLHRRPSELTVASELTAVSMVGGNNKATTADQLVLPAAKALHTLTDDEEAAIVSLATATGNNNTGASARWSTRASIPSVRFFQQRTSTSAAPRNY